MKLKPYVTASVLILCSAFAFCQRKDTSKTQRMTSAEYGEALDHLQVNLDPWEATLQKVDPGNGDPSYTAGKLIESNRDVALLQISNLRAYIPRERKQRSVYGELGISAFLSELNTDVYALTLQGALNSVSVQAVSQLGAEIGDMQKTFWMDGTDGVKSMEATGCGNLSR